MSSQTRRHIVTFLWLALAALMAVAVLYWGQVSRIPTVPVVDVERGPVERVLSVVGRIAPKQEVNVRTEQPGQVIELLKDESDSVTAGEIIARVAAEEEVATLSASRAEAAALAAELKRAQNQLARTRELRQKGFVSSQTLDDGLAEVDALQARLAAAQAAERQLAVRAEKFVIRAPIDGVVLARPVDPGQVVSTDTSLFDIGSVALEIEAEADEYYADAVQLGQAAKIRAAGALALYDATVAEISPRVDPTTGGRLVRLDTQAMAASLLPGRTIYVSIVIEQLADAISVPRSAVRLLGGQYQVLAVVDNRVSILPVQVLDWPGQKVIVTEGLQGTETVIAMPTRLVAGDQVRPEADRLANRDN